MKKNTPQKTNRKGRPTLYPSLTELPSKLLEMQEMFAQGHSKAAVGIAVFGICADTFHQWEKDRDKIEFARAVKTGVALALLWWEQKARQAVDDKNVNTASLIWNMKNRFPQSWKDRQDVDHTFTGPMEIRWMTKPKSTPKK